MTVRVRFAPSPTGHLHVGNVRTALYNWLFARQNHGTFVLRLEDTDVERSEMEFEEQLMEDLRWLGLDWDEGVGVGGACGPYRQTERLELYQRYAEQLMVQQKAYHCFCSAQELEEERQRQLAAGGPPRYSGKCRALSAQETRHQLEVGKEAVVRLKVRHGTVGFDDLVFGHLDVECSEIGDFVLLRSDRSATYNFACVVDDAAMKMTHVIRGEGHVANTYRQVLIYGALGFQTPSFAHLSTILGPDGSKLSKRHGATSIDEFRRQGYLPEALLNYLALLGWAPREEGREILGVNELVAEFDLSRVHRSPATFDWEKLNWVNRSHLRGVKRERLVDLVVPYLQEQGWIPERPSPEVKQWLGEVVEAVLNYLDKLDDVAGQVELIFNFEPARFLSQPDLQEVLSAGAAGAVIREFYNQLCRQETLDLERYKAAANEVKKATGQKGKDLFHPIRVALTARSSGPELDKLVPIFERGKRLDLPARVLGVKERVQSVLQHLP